MNIDFVVRALFDVVPRQLESFVRDRLRKLKLDAGGWTSTPGTHGTGSDAGGTTSPIPPCS